jgi:hypothetical protein
MEKFCIVFDGPPDHHSPRFVEIEVGGKSIRLGTWRARPDGLWELSVTAADLEALEKS